VVDVPAAAHGAGGFSIANRQLTVENRRNCGLPGPTSRRSACYHR
jgi:hypothetical protein